MANQVMIFEGNKVEVFELGGTVYFNPYDVGRCLGLTDSAVRKAAGNMNDNQAIKLKNSDVKKSNIRKFNNAGELFLTESGVYKLVFRSNKPKAEKFTDWVTDEVLPAIRKEGAYVADKANQEAIFKQKEIEARLINSKVRQANVLLKIAKEANIEEYKQVLHSYASQIVTGKRILPLPEAHKETYSAKEIGDIVGISANMVGRLANTYGLKTEQYGKLFYDKSAYSNKQVETFRYYDTIIPVLKNLSSTEVC